MIAEYYDKIAFENTLFPLKVALDRELNESTLHRLMINHLTWHEEMELKLYKKGGATLQIGSEILYVQAGDMVIVSPCEPHSTIAVDQHCCYDTLVVNFGFLKSFFEEGRKSKQFASLIDDGIIFRKLIRDNERAKRALESIFAEFRYSKTVNETAMIGLLVYLLSVLIETEIAEKGTVSRKSMDKLKKIQPAIEYINGNYNHPLPLETLAERCALEKVYFSKLFKEVMKTTVVEYIAGVRQTSAETLLSITDKKVCEVAWLCGFEDPCYFDRWFKARKGISPCEYRKNKTLKGE